VHQELQKLWKIEDYWAVWRSTSRSAISRQLWCSPGSGRTSGRWC